MSLVRRVPRRQRLLAVSSFAVRGPVRHSSRSSTRLHKIHDCCCCTRVGDCVAPDSRHSWPGHSIDETFRICALYVVRLRPCHCLFTFFSHNPPLQHALLLLPFNAWKSPSRPSWASSRAAASRTTPPSRKPPQTSAKNRSSAQLAHARYGR